MPDQQEQTLQEYVERLPRCHRARRQYEQLCSSAGRRRDDIPEEDRADMRRAALITALLVAAFLISCAYGVGLVTG